MVRLLFSLGVAVLFYVSLCSAQQLPLTQCGSGQTFSMQLGTGKTPAATSSGYTLNTVGAFYGTSANVQIGAFAAYRRFGASSPSSFHFHLFTWPDNTLVHTVTATGFTQTGWIMVPVGGPGTSSVITLTSGLTYVIAYDMDSELFPYFNTVQTRTVTAGLSFSGSGQAGSLHTTPQFIYNSNAANSFPVEMYLADCPALPNDGSTGVPNDGSTGVPDDGSTGVPDDGSTGVPNDGSTGVPNDGSTGVPNDGSTGEPNDGSTGVPNDGSTGVPNDGSTGVPNDGSTGVPNDGSTGVPNDGSTGVPNDGSTGVPNDGSTGAINEGCLTWPIANTAHFDAAIDWYEFGYRFEVRNVEAELFGFKFEYASHIIDMTFTLSLWLDVGNVVDSTGLNPLATGTTQVIAAGTPSGYIIVPLVTTASAASRIVLPAGFYRMSIHGTGVTATNPDWASYVAPISYACVADMPDADGNGNPCTNIFDTLSGLVQIEPVLAFTRGSYPGEPTQYTPAGSNQVANIGFMFCSNDGSTGVPNDGSTGAVNDGSTGVPNDGSTGVPNDGSTGMSPVGDCSSVWGACENYAVHAGTSVNFNGPTSTIHTGSVGVSPQTSITGSVLVSSGSTDVNNFAATSCAIDKQSTFDYLRGLTCTHPLDSADLAGRTLLPGVWCFGSMTLSAGTFTLDGAGDRNAKWIFQTSTTLITATATSIVLINGASATNVIWVVGSSATLAGSSSFIGQIIAGVSVTLGSSCTVVGRQFALAAVTYDGDGSTTLPLCSVNDGSTGVPNDGSTGAVNDGSTGVPNDGSTGVPNDGSTGVPNDGSTGVPNDGSTGEPNDGSTGVPNDGSTGQVNDGSTGVHQQLARNCSSMWGVCANYAVHAATAVSFDGPSSTIYSGSVGVAPGTSLTGDFYLVSGSIDNNNAAAIACAADKQIAFDYLVGLTCTHPLDSANLAGRTLLPGVWCFGAMGLSAGTLTLDGAGDPNAEWVFQTSTTLVTSTATSVVLINGAHASNVYWAIGSSATLSYDSSFIGQIVAGVSVTVGSSCLTVGRHFALAAVTYAGGGMTSKQECATLNDGSTGQANDGSTGHVNDGSTGVPNDGSTGEVNDGSTGHADDGSTGEVNDGSTGQAFIDPPPAVVVIDQVVLQANFTAIMHQLTQLMDDAFMKMNTTLHANVTAAVTTSKVLATTGMTAVAATLGLSATMVIINIIGGL